MDTVCHHAESVLTRALSATRRQENILAFQWISGLGVFSDMHR